MQELRFVLIIVGALAIAALLFHGLWTSKKEGKAKFGDKPLGKLDNGELDSQDDLPSRSFAPEDDFEIIRKERKEPDFATPEFTADPLIDSDVLMSAQSVDAKKSFEPDEVPSFSVTDTSETLEDNISESIYDEAQPESVLRSSPEVVESGIKQAEPAQAFESESSQIVRTSPVNENQVSDFEESAIQESVTKDEEPELEVIVLNVHCAGEAPFIGTELFRSMENNGLTYGEMAIYHCYAGNSDSPKVIFSVANMMQPGTLEHDNRADFSTKGISFFMTLPCFGEADQNFNVMLRAAQKIADDMGGNVLDESRNLMTPNRLSDYRKQIRDFMTK
ncbi:cell division protein ZipA [Vibrio sp. 99-70-13A1]|uniref:cell division protein ZipA n=1 Tax=Vibrio sp. 99-70-13A1 TaxID=2607601 RepID=UPI00149385EE|nr:cell division protein ZipA [Vibrio sp. 99-70-13A1]NOH99349.1 cell division protein ZipA [Vibrio sp. 99-70-13A1]